MNETTNKSNGTKIILIATAGVAAVALCLCMGLAGFAVGRGTTEADTITEIVTETITELVEVTREVPIESTVEVLVEKAVEVEVVVTATPDPDAPADGQPIETVSGLDDLDLSVLDEVWDIIEDDFDGDDPAKDDLLYSVIEGSLEALGDDYTRFIRPDVAERMREDMGGSVSGIGAFVRENDDGYFEIIAPIEGQPADIAGLLPNDLLIEVNGESVVGLSFDEVILMVRGPEGSSVDLGIAREGEDELLEFTIIRTRFEVPVVESEMLENNVAYVKLTEFNRDSSDKLEEALQELLAQNPTGLILDLRNNPGGFLDESINVADLFLPEGVALHERNNAGLDQTFSTHDGDPAEKIPMVVLINQGSASASEIVAGAIQDRERGILIGETSFGKGSVQTIHTISDGSELRVTIARWYTPNNNSINGEGIDPDIEVERTIEDFENDLDPQLQRAIEEILNRAK